MKQLRTGDSFPSKQDIAGSGRRPPVWAMLAITMNDDQVAEIDYERCLGYGVCARACPIDAIRLEQRGEEIYTPYLDYNELVAAMGKTHAVHSH